MRILLDTRARKGALRADRAWSFFCPGSKGLSDDGEYWSFALWLWDELGERAGSLNVDAGRTVEVTVPKLKEEALDLVLRLASYWAMEVRSRTGRKLSENLWRRPVINLLEDRARSPAERATFRDFSDQGSKELNLMPLLGLGRSFFSLQVIKKGDSTARMHSHTAVDEYYLILEGKGTLRFNGREVPVREGDLVAKPAGPDAATHLVADRGGPLRILDTEVWHQPFKGSHRTSKDLILWPDHRELMLRGPGWSAMLSRDALHPTKDLERHWSELYHRTADGKRKPVKRGTRRGRKS